MKAKGSAKIVWLNLTRDRYLFIVKKQPERHAYLVRLFAIFKAFIS
jgi:hypothetical protein